MSHKSKRSEDEIKINYYEVFGLTKTATKKEIIIKYRELVKKYHPDKNPLHGKLFELIQRAWECLSDDKKRKEYDGHIESHDKIKKDDFFSMKKNFEEYNELKKTDISEEAKKKALIEFNKINQELDDSIGYDRELEKEKITKKEITEKIEDFISSREQEEIENEQDKIFDEEEKFDPFKFNILYEKYKNKHKTDMIIRPTGPNAFNDSLLAEYSDINISKKENITDISYDDDEIIKFTPEDLKKIKYDSHNKQKEKPLDKETYNELLERRKKETDELGKIPLNKFINEPDKSFTFTNNLSKIAYDDDSDLVDACKKLIELEKK
jgi:curved DNA-binding protein CbpA